MYDFFMTLINNATHLIDMGRRSEKDEEENSHPAIEPVESKKKSIANENKTSHEVEVISKEFGGLKEGMRIEIELSRILEILPRTRRKADAYKGLRAELKKHGVELVITSTRHPKTKIL